MYLTVVAMASLLVMAFNLNSNMNSNMNAYASIFSNIQNADDIGQSLECVIVVVGCDGQGSVGSSGDVNIGSGNDDNSTNGGGGDPLTCEECFTENLTPAQLAEFNQLLNGTIAEACVEIMALTPENFATFLVNLEHYLLSIGVSASVIIDIQDCLQAAYE